MKKTMGIINHTFRYLLPGTIATTLFLFVVATAVAQSTSQLPSPTGHVNDFAKVIDEQTKSRVEGILRNLKDKTKVDFYVATVETTGGQDIFDYSRKLATEWNIGSKNS